MTRAKKPEYVEGREAFQNFENALGAVMKVPHAEIRAGLEAERKAKMTAHKRQPKRKRP